MGRYELEYPRDATNLIKRHGERGSYALEKIHSLINSAQILHVSFNPPDSPFPVILPMIGQMGSFDRPSASLGDPLDVYLHGYVSARIFNTGRAAGSQGMPVCVAASHVDGLVLALSAFNHSYNYRSAVLFGHATIVDDEEEKLFAMQLITDSVVPGRWQNTRLPPTRAEMQSTSILRVKIASGSAKIHEGSAVDDKHDLANEDALNSIWTGVVPVYTAMGSPLPGPHNRVELPEYASEFLDQFNQESKEHSIAAAKKE
ncbi:pyridoxamine 5'-phosphate oxidase domain-containing protein [Hirsutella rhossiliensis]|uniref:Pyridoxamine 5'-phosphate oxidase domain-containing protein n=1 Tax=Hirsutella rhossiliensis TaxID=111463 RepID=A0A9P8MW19_9HYPO|nr:pyridoxamine 5'-phosphate oxidase domain-containing protein [Hirsutella rhossiliensis]KAH0961439.1 pyridoxamine 5'-phosphate oxidase domain-containing protein [Hirsutella rhossiliensis]